MKAKTLSLVAGMALGANVGLAQAVELDETAGMPEILGAAEVSEAALMNQEEMSNVKGEFIPIWLFRIMLDFIQAMEEPKYDSYLPRVPVTNPQDNTYVSDGKGANSYGGF